MVAHRAGSGAVVGCSDVVARERRTGDQDAGRPRALSLVKPVFGGWLQQDIDPSAGVAPVVTLDLTGMEAPASDGGAEPAPEVLEVGPGKARSGVSSSSRRTPVLSTWSTRGGSWPWGPAPPATACATPSASSPTCSTDRSARPGR